MTARTLYDKLWDDHLVRQSDDGTALIYIDRQLLHEVTSPQAFAGLREAGRQPRRRAANLAVADHNVPTTDRNAGIVDPVSRLQVQTLDSNCAEFGITEFDMADPRQGVVHVVGPEQGVTQPGMTIVCGDSHTATHGALGALAFGIGTSEVEHVLATQCLVARKMQNLRITLTGPLPEGIASKDMILAVIGLIGTSGGTGYAMEFAGSAVREASIEARMTLCNMAIEGGARAGLVGVDEATVSYMAGRPYVPSGSAFDNAAVAWREMVSDPDAAFDLEFELDVSRL
ncbi:MAG TPA: aconitase family protein, partial [Arenicellales bacterium]|nr:aconitase family protein [Arenicellales bacterium]